MRLVVALANGRRLDLELPDPETTTVGDVKRLVWQLEGVPPAFQRLDAAVSDSTAVRGFQVLPSKLADARTLASYGFKASSTSGQTAFIKVRLNLRGRKIPSAAAPVTSPSPTTQGPFSFGLAPPATTEKAASSEETKTEEPSTPESSISTTSAPAENEEEITVTIRRWANLQFDVQVLPSDNVLKLKLCVCERWGAQPADQRLMYRQSELEDERTIGSYGITNNTVITLW